MEAISNWFDAMDPTLRIYWGITIFSTVVFVIQMVMSFVGIGDMGDADVDTDFSGGDSDGLDDAGAMSLISIRNIIYFLLGLGWSGVSLWNTIPNQILLTIVSIGVGCLFVAVFIFLFRQMMKLQSNGAFNINDSVGRICDVYMRIPANSTGLGKVQISFGGSVHELDARTNESEMIPSGSRVKVTEVIDKHVLVVERI